MELAIIYLAKTIWNRPIYGLTIAPFVVLFCLQNDMVREIEAYEGTIVWKKTKRVKGIPQGHYERIAPCPEWLRAYIPDRCENHEWLRVNMPNRFSVSHGRRNNCAHCSGW